MTNKNLILAENKEIIVDMGNQIKALLPGGQSLSDKNAMSVANYAALTKANPFRGEVYGYQSGKGDLILVDGYKLLVRWAKSISDYDEDYGERLPVGVEGIEEGDIGYRITIMRYDKKKGIKEYVDMGAPFKEAYDLVSNSAIGIVKANETYNSKYKKAVPPPKGWSWDEVARKRALKNVLNRAFAMPSVEQLAALNWEVNGQETLPEDWAGPEVYRNSEEAERHAELSAQERERQKKVADMTETEKAEFSEGIASATEIMRSNGDDDPLQDAEELPKQMHPSAKFWQWANGQGIERGVAGQFVQEANGNFDKALEALKSSR